MIAKVVIKSGEITFPSFLFILFTLWMLGCSFCFEGVIVHFLLCVQKKTQPKEKMQTHCEATPLGHSAKTKNSLRSDMLRFLTLHSVALVSRFSAIVCKLTHSHRWCILTTHAVPTSASQCYMVTAFTAAP